MKFGQNTNNAGVLYSINECYVHLPWSSIYSLWQLLSLTEMYVNLIKDKYMRPGDGLAFKSLPTCYIRILLH